jgi:hypothetical protein
MLDIKQSKEEVEEDIKYFRRQVCQALKVPYLLLFPEEEPKVTRLVNQTITRIR